MRLFPFTASRLNHSLSHCAPSSLCSASLCCVFAHTCTEWVPESVCDLPGLLNMSESHAKPHTERFSVSVWRHQLGQKKKEKRRMEVEDEKLLTHTGIVCVRAGGAATYCLRSAPASCLSAHSQKHACAHERPLRLWACARPQKRVNASVRLAGLLRPSSHRLTGRNFNERALIGKRRM